MKIRTARPEDAVEILKIYAYYVRETAITFEYDVPQEEEFRNRISETLKNYPYLVAEEGGKIAGYAYASIFKGRIAYQHSAEVSIYIDREFRGRGIGRALYEELERELLKQNVFTLYACITVTDRKDDPFLNDDSAIFHGRMGYRLCGRHENCGYKFSRWYSMIWMEKNIGNRPEHPDDFIPFGGGDNVR